MPRTLGELTERLQERPYVIFDGFADSYALVSRAARTEFGLLKSKQNLPHFQLEYNAYKSDDRVGGQALSSGHRMIALVEGTRTIILEDQVVKAKLRVEVRKRD